MSAIGSNAVVVAGGDRLGTKRIDFPEDALVICADSGVRLALELGLPVHVVVGDFDSADPADVERAESAGAKIERHPPAKDQTDLELALIWARDAGCGDVLVIGLAGGRLDHFVANVLVLGSEAFAEMRISAATQHATAQIVRSKATLRGSAGSIVTLLALGGDATAVSTTGLEYPLAAETLPSGSSRGVSNVMTTTQASVSVESGVVLAIQIEET